MGRIPRWIQRVFLLFALLTSAAIAAQAAPGEGTSATLADRLVQLDRLHARQSFAAVESLATIILTEFDTVPDPDSLAIARVHAHLGDAQEPKRGWTRDDDCVRHMKMAVDIRARHLPPNHPDLAFARMRLGELSAPIDPDGALACLYLAIAAFETAGAPYDTLLANCLVDAGTVETEYGQPVLAVPLLERAVAMRTAIFGREHYRTASALRFLGWALQGIGELEAARAVTEESVAIFERTMGPGSAWTAVARTRLITICLDQGDMSHALALARESWRSAGNDVTSSEAFASASNYANILIQFSDFEGACRVLEPFADFGAGSTNVLHQRKRVTYAQVYSNAACETGQLDRAEYWNGVGVAGLKVLPEAQRSSLAALFLMGLAEIRVRQERLAEARDLYGRLIPLNDAAGQPELTTRVVSRTHLIQILEAMGDTAGVDSVRNDLARIRTDPGLAQSSQQPVIDHWLAHADRWLGRDAQAWREALASADGNRTKLLRSAEQLPDGRALELAERTSHHLAQVLDMAVEAPDGDRPAAAWDRLVQARGLVRSVLARRRLPPSLAQHADLAEAHEAWVSSQRALSRQLVRGTPAPDDSAGQADLAARRERAELDEQELAMALQRYGADTLRVDVILDDVRALLGADEAMIGIFQHETRDDQRRLAAFVMKGGAAEIAVIELGSPEELRAIIDPWLAALGRVPTGDGRAAERECHRLGTAVRTATWDRFIAACGDVHTLFVVPEGQLADLPWGALPDGDGYLVDRDRDIRVLDAERDLVRPVAPDDDGRLLALGDPDYGAGATTDAAPGELVLRDSPDPCEGSLPTVFPPLPGTRTETEGIAAAWARGDPSRRVLLLGAAATEAAVRSSAPGCRVIHLATHGIVTGDRCRESVEGERGVGGVAPVPGSSAPAATVAVTTVSATPATTSTAVAAPAIPPVVAPSPWLGRRVWLALAGAGNAAEANNGDDDGLLTAEEVVTMDLSGTDWVVLSACHSGVADAWTREGALGMKRAFTLAGARTLIASQWGVSDEATAVWMQALYAARIGGETHASLAARAASRAVLAVRRGAGQSTHPFYWAAFLATGE